MEENEAEQGERRQSVCCGRFQTSSKSIFSYILPKHLRSDYMDRANCVPPPIFIILVSIAELVVFIYYAVWKPHKQWVTLDESIWKSRFTYLPEKREEAWRFISYMLVHAGVEHILGNLLMQLVLGTALELVHKGIEVGVVYMAGVLAGSLASSIFDSSCALVGASGGVYALLGGYFMNAVVNFRQMKLFPALVRISMVVLYLILDFGSALYRRFGTHEGGVQVSFVAHLGGLFARMAFGYVFFSEYDKKLLKDPRFWICIFSYAACFIFAVFFNIFFFPES